ncbi:MAG: peptidoglycan-binding domain-containing protein [Christensenellaceae bacterium]
MAKGEADGIFGAGTKAAVIAFQKRTGLTADGIVGVPPIARWA